MTELDIRRVTGALGAVVTGLDLKQPVPAESFAALEAALFEHLVLFFPEQHLDDAQQEAFARRFGSPYIHPLGRLLGVTEARVERIVDSDTSHPYQDRWHTDVSFDVTPPTIGTLRAIEIPAFGGDTLWASTRAAYESLSEGLRDRLEGLVAIHDSGDGKAFAEKAGAELAAKLERAYPGTRHRMVEVHPVTGRRHLYVNRQFTRRIEGLASNESDALLEEVYSHVENPNLQLRHAWRAGDVGLWDERATWHFAAADHYPQRREMGRMVVTAQGSPAPGP